MKDTDVMTYAKKLKMVYGESISNIRDYDVRKVDKVNFQPDLVYMVDGKIILYNGEILVDARGTIEAYCVHLNDALVLAVQTNGSKRDVLMISEKENRIDVQRHEDTTIDGIIYNGENLGNTVYYKLDEIGVMLRDGTRLFKCCGSEFRAIKIFTATVTDRKCRLFKKYPNKEVKSLFFGILSKYLKFGKWIISFSTSIFEVVVHSENEKFVVCTYNIKYEKDGDGAVVFNRNKQGEIESFTFVGYKLNLADGINVINTIVYDTSEISKHTYTFTKDGITEDDTLQTTQESIHKRKLYINMRTGTSAVYLNDAG